MAPIPVGSPSTFQASRCLWALFFILLACLCGETVLVHDALLRRQEEIARLLGWELGEALETMRAFLLVYGAVAAALGACLFPAARLVGSWRRGPRRGEAGGGALGGSGPAAQGPAGGEGAASQARAALEAEAPAAASGACAGGGRETKASGREAGEVAQSRQWAYVLDMGREMRSQAIGVLGLVELLLSGRLSETQRGFAETARFSAKTLLSASTDIINLIWFAVGNVQPLPEPFAPRALADGVLDRYSGEARQRGVELCAQVAPEVPPLVVGDLKGLEQVLRTLLESALQMTASGRVELSLRLPQARPEDGETLQLLCEVRDTGEGVPPRVQERVFGRYSDTEAAQWQTGSVEQRLRLARKLLELMGCHLALASLPGAGSTLRFKLPVLETGQSPATPLHLEPPPCGEAIPFPARPGSPAAPPRPGEPADGLRPPRILLVEKEYEHQTMCLVMLETLKCQVTVASSMAGALKHLARQHFDAVLLDAQMHRTESVARLREGTGEAAAALLKGQIPVIVMGEHDFLKKDHQKWAAGVDGWLGKPFTLETLAGELGRWLPGRLQEVGTGAGPLASRPGRGEAAQAQARHPLDERVLDGIRSLERGSPHLLVSLAERYLQEAPRHLAELRAALAGEAWTEVRLAAHALRSCSALLGARALADLCNNLEVRCAGGAPAEADMLGARIEAEFALVCAAMEAIRRNGHD